MRGVLGSRHRRGLATVSLLVLGLAGGSVAYAAIPDANGVIHACYDEQSGQARIVDDADGTPKGCGAKEAAISWGQVGPQGPQGPTGPQGTQGPQGEKGDDGAPGVSGWERRSESILVPHGDNNQLFADAMCSSGKKPLGGGYQLKDEEGVDLENEASDEVLASVPLSNGWHVAVQQDEDEDFTLIAWTVCADFSP